MILLADANTCHSLMQSICCNNHFLKKAALMKPIEWLIKHMGRVCHNTVL